MRILNLTDRVPYPVISGAPLRTYNLLQRLARDHEVWLAAFVFTQEEMEGVLHLRQFCQGVETARGQSLGALARPVDAVRYLLAGKPPDLRLTHSQELAREIRSLTSTTDFDIVQIEHARMGLYLDALPAKMQSRAIWMLHDIDWSKYARISRFERKRARQLRLWFHSQMLRRWKPNYAERFGCCITVSESDRRLLMARNPRLNVAVVPNGVDTQINRPLRPLHGPPALLFVGNMGYPPNVDAIAFFCRMILPHIRQVIADVQVWVVGIDPAPEVWQLSGNGVHVTGRVDDLHPYYSRSAACVIPLRGGGGTRLKILEAMALGRPVVSTSIGCEGLDVVDGEQILIADAPEEFAQKTVQLLTDAALRQRIATNARELVTTLYDWDVLTARLVQVYAEVADRRTTLQ
jgi:polysaccharide biosynthesis protein PslH